MKNYQINSIALLFGLLTIFAACSEENVDPPKPDDQPPSLASGDLIPMNLKVRIDKNGTYTLPDNASLLTTRCFGKVTVTFQPPNGQLQMNTCHNTTSSSSQSNVVSGVTEVDFEVEAGSYAHVTLN
ncbi:MAG: hypothetical protein ACR2MX_19505 [Cyclobacteriaceae bacterium]